MPARGAAPGAARPTLRERPSARGCSDPQDTWQAKAGPRSEGVSRSQTLGVTSVTARPLLRPSSALGLPQEITLSAARRGALTHAGRKGRGCESREPGCLCPRRPAAVPRPRRPASRLQPCGARRRASRPPPRAPSAAARRPAAPRFLAPRPAARASLPRSGSRRGGWQSTARSSNFGFKGYCRGFRLGVWTSRGKGNVTGLFFVSLCLELHLDLTSHANSIGWRK